MNVQPPPFFFCILTLLGQFILTKFGQDGVNISMILFQFCDLTRSCHGDAVTGHFTARKTGSEA